MDKVCSNQFPRLLRCQMRQRESSLQQITHIRGRKSRQNLEFQLMKQFWVPIIGLLPLQLDTSHEPKQQW